MDLLEDSQAGDDALRRDDSLVLYLTFLEDRSSEQIEADYLKVHTDTFLHCPARPLCRSRVLTLLSWTYLVSTVHDLKAR